MSFCKDSKASKSILSHFYILAYKLYYFYFCFCPITLYVVNFDKICYTMFEIFKKRWLYVQRFIFLYASIYDKRGNSFRFCWYVYPLHCVILGWLRSGLSKVLQCDSPKTFKRTRVDKTREKSIWPLHKLINSIKWSL